MPFTPFHFGPSSIIGLLWFKYFDLPTLMIASVIIDIEPFMAIFFDAPWPLHGFIHSFLGGSLIAGFTAVVLYNLKRPIKIVMNYFKLAQDSSLKNIILSSFFGVYSHILLDAFMHQDMNPFYPLSGNPFLNWFSSGLVYLSCGIMLTIGVLLYLKAWLTAKK